jgi:hypothetical protein
MDPQLNLDSFYSWVCEVNDKVRSMEETLERVRAWGVASLCWQVKLTKIRTDLHKLRVDVANSIATREANRVNLILDSTADGKPAQVPAVRTKVVPMLTRKRIHAVAKDLGPRV